MFFVGGAPISLGIIPAWRVVSTLFHRIFFLAANARLRLLLCFVTAMMAAAVSDIALRERMRALLAGIAAIAGALLRRYFRTTFPPGPQWQPTGLVAIAPLLASLFMGAFLSI